MTEDAAVSNNTDYPWPKCPGCGATYQDRYRVDEGQPEIVSLPCAFCYEPLPVTVGRT